jgi:hypothetical protein
MASLSEKAGRVAAEELNDRAIVRITAITVNRKCGAGCMLEGN